MPSLPPVPGPSSDLSAGHQHVLVAPHRQSSVVVHQEFGDGVQRAQRRVIVGPVERAKDVQEIVVRGARS